MAQDIDKPLWGIFGNTSEIKVWAFILPLEENEPFDAESVIAATHLKSKRVDSVMSMLIDNDVIRPVKGQGGHGFVQGNKFLFHLNKGSAVVHAMRRFLISGYWDYIHHKSLKYAVIKSE